MLKLNKSQIDRIEQQIATPVHIGITLPVEGLPTGYVVRVSASPFSLGAKPFKEVTDNLKTIAARLSL